jgi:hypothetical protein
MSQSYYELKRHLIALSKMLDRAIAECKPHEVIVRIQNSIEQTREELSECEG